MERELSAAADRGIDPPLSLLIISGIVFYAQIGTQIAGEIPNDHIVGLHHILTAAVVGIPIVDPVHPARQAAAVKLIQIADAFERGTVLPGALGKLQVLLVLLEGAL